MKWLWAKVTFCVVLVQVLLWAAILCSTGCGTQSPFGRDDGESTPAEDAAAIAAYTQTINQVQTSTTDLDVTAGGDVFIVTGDGTFSYRPVQYAPPPETETDNTDQ